MFNIILELKNKKKKKIKMQGGKQLYTSIVRIKTKL
jgi:hypothetical protein